MSSKTTARRRRRKSPNKSTSNRTLWLIAAAALGLVIVAIWLNAREAGNVATVVEAEAAYKDLPTEWINGSTLGNPDAPVTIQTWEDFM